MHFLLINPWIYDFAAYDLWQRSLSLLNMGAVLRNNGFTLSLLDCLDRNDPVLISSKKYSTLDELSFPVFDQNQNVYRMPLLTSRGCPPRCSICVSYIVSGKFKK
ncbi:hypothetical protein IIB79_11630, partial [candidate division KSB1 bacterium]|nr:hypothetical protein [candidate division KSB1 bacterium]